MAYSEVLEDRLRTLLADTPGITSKKMFGGIAFMQNGNMCCGVMGDELMVRVGPKGYEAALAKPHAHELPWRPMKGTVIVAPTGIASDEDLQGWIQQALQFVATLPAK